MSANRDFGFRAKNRFFELETQVFAKVSAPLGSTAFAGTSPKNVPESKNVSKNIAEVVESVGIETSRPRASEAGMTETVI
jgi:hypothetical protein